MVTPVCRTRPLLWTTAFTVRRPGALRIEPETATSSTPEDYARVRRAYGRHCKKGPSVAAACCSVKPNSGEWPSCPTCRGLRTTGGNLSEDQPLHARYPGDGSSSYGLLHL